MVNNLREMNERFKKKKKKSLDNLICNLSDTTTSLVTSEINTQMVAYRGGCFKKSHVCQIIPKKDYEQGLTPINYIAATLYFDVLPEFL